MPSISVVSWNVLADSYVKAEYYPFTDARHLEPSERQRRVVERAVSLDADVFCLQEVEPVLFAALARALPSHEAHRRGKVGKPDGCAVFVRRSLGPATFDGIVFGDGSGHVALAAKVLGIGVVSTHLRWQPETTPPDERLGIGELREVLDAWVTDASGWIVCGDLNAEATSPVLAVAFARSLRDAYEATPDAYTANANGRCKRIDFVLYGDRFSATATPTPAIVAETPLPSETEPSDHLPLRVTLAF